MQEAANRLEGVANEKRRDAEKRLKAETRSRLELDRGHNNVARSVLADELRLLDEDAAEEREEREHSAIASWTERELATAAAAAKVLAEAEATGAALKAAAIEEVERLKASAAIETAKQEEAKEVARKAREEADAAEIRSGQYNVAKEMLAAELRMYDEQCREERKMEAEQVRRSLEAELRIAEGKAEETRLASEARARSHERKAERLMRRAAGVLEAKKSEAHQLLGAEYERTERMRRYYAVARQVMKEELYVLDQEERLDYLEKLDADMEEERQRRLSDIRVDAPMRRSFSSLVSPKRGVRRASALDAGDGNGESVDHRGKLEHKVRRNETIDSEGQGLRTSPSMKLPIRASRKVVSRVAQHLISPIRSRPSSELRSSSSHSDDVVHAACAVRR
uniref:Uncharacterized protein n=1 Tax=Haptolina brevifila TaxID=156173 RepID=A0A7S2DIQ4_9EUKA